MVKVVTDTASGIAPESEIARELGITVIPMHIIFGTESYLDGIDISADEIYHRLRNKEIPTTSSPSPGEVAAIFDKLAEETDDILAVILSSGYSVAYEAVLGGKEMMKKKCRVETIDSLHACGAEAILAINAANEAKEGKSLDNVSEMVRSSIPKTHMRMTFDTLEYVRRSGRIGRVPALIGSMLKINPILMTDNDGRASPCARVRSRAKAIDWLYDFVKGFKDIKDLVVEYADISDDAERLIQMIDPIFPRERMYTLRVSPMVGSYVGPSIIGVTVVER